MREDKEAIELKAGMMFIVETIEDNEAVELNALYNWLTLTASVRAVPAATPVILPLFKPMLAPAFVIPKAWPLALLPLMYSKPPNDKFSVPAVPEPSGVLP